MKVKELVAKLQKLDQNLLVTIDDYVRHSGTVLEEISDVKVSSTKEIGPFAKLFDQKLKEGDKFILLVRNEA